MELVIKFSFPNKFICTNKGQLKDYLFSGRKSHGSCGAYIQILGLGFRVDNIGWSVGIQIGYGRV